MIVSNNVKYVAATVLIGLTCAEQVDAQQRSQFPSQMYECLPVNDGHFTTLGTLFFSVFDEPYVGTIRYVDFRAACV